MKKLKRLLKKLLKKLSCCRSSSDTDSNRQEDNGRPIQPHRPTGSQNGESRRDTLPGLADNFLRADRELKERYEQEHKELSEVEENLRDVVYLYITGAIEKEEAKESFIRAKRYLAKASQLRGNGESSINGIQTNQPIQYPSCRTNRKGPHDEINSECITASDFWSKSKEPWPTKSDIKEQARQFGIPIKKLR